MAAVLTGTPLALTWSAGADPFGQSITIPADATAVYLFWFYYSGASGSGFTVLVPTLAAASPDQTFGTLGDVNTAPTGVIAWYNPPTGSQTIDLEWSKVPDAGPLTIVAFVKDGDVTAWRDADALGSDAGNPATVEVTLTTVSGDLVIKMDQADGAMPSLSASWTNAQTQTVGSSNARLSTISASGATTLCACEDESFSSIVAISIPSLAAPPIEDQPETLHVIRSGIRLR